MAVALVDFTADYDGGTVEIRKGITRVADDHELAKGFPARFGSGGSSYVRSDRGRSREDPPMNETESREVERPERDGEELELEDVRRLREWPTEREREERNEWLRERARSGQTEAGASFGDGFRRRDELSRNDNVPKHVAEAYDRGLYAIIKRCFTRVGTSEDHNGNPCAVLSSTTWYAALSVN